MELAVSCCSDTVESFWVRIKGQANKVDVVVGVYYRPNGQDDNTDEMFFKELRDTCRSAVLVLMSAFSLPDMNWEYHTADYKQIQEIPKPP